MKYHPGKASRNNGNLFFFVSVFFAILALSGCSIKLVEDYDPLIDNGLMEYFEATDKFLNQAKSGQAAPYEESRQFYLDMYSKLDSLILRAEAGAKLDKCAGSQMVNDAIDKLLSSEKFLKGLGVAGDLFDDIKNERENPAGSCTVVMLKIVKRNHQIMETIHKKENNLVGPVIDILKPTIEQGVKMVLKIELSKKRGEREGVK
ncbi:MAG: hypothetical protein HZA14_03640 [Nitrospirae bacterium]|nr:hypothetical protein [Nitrospirota bacterium]